MTGPGHGGVGAPWWASGSDDLDDHEDPLAAHREARAAAGDPRRAWGDVDHDPPPPDGAVRSTFEDALEGLAMLSRAAAHGARRVGRRDGDEAGRPPPDGDDAACRGCPWCTVTRSLADSRPEVTEHLEQAMRHVVLAARAWVDAAERRVAPAPHWEPIPLDDEEQP